MDELISRIEYVTGKLLLYDRLEYAQAAEDLANLMMARFSEVIAWYSIPEMSEYAENATYWPNQLERILNAFNTGDDLATADILYNETRANLIELREQLKGKGLI